MKRQCTKHLEATYHENRITLAKKNGAAKPFLYHIIIIVVVVVVAVVDNSCLLYTSRCV